MFGHNDIKDMFVCRLQGNSTQKYFQLKYFQLTLIDNIVKCGIYMFHNIIKQKENITWAESQN